MSGDFALLRTPLLPAQEAWKLANIADVGPFFRDAKWGAAATEALYLSSQSLYQRLTSGETPEEGVQIAWARYARRMGTRCTPFALSAGVTVLEVGDHSAVRLAAPEAVRRVCRLDQGVLSRLLERRRREIEAEEARADLKLSLNSSTWRASDGHRYVELVEEAGVKRYRLTRMRTTPAIDLAVALFEQGTLPLGEASQRFAQAVGCDPAAATDFLRNLVQKQLLTPEPRLTANCDDGAAHMLRQMRDIDGGGAICGILEQVLDAVAQVATGEADNITAYEKVGGLLREQSLDTDTARTVHVDLHKSASEKTIGRDVLDVVARELWSARGLLSRRNPTMQRFAAEFTARYGDAELPLLQVLDEDFGIAFGGLGSPEAPLVAPIGLAAAGATTKLLPALEGHLLDRLLAWSPADGPLDLTALAASLAEQAPPPPRSFSVIGAFHAPSQADWTGGRFTFEPKLAYGPAMSLFGRFCCGEDALTEHVRQFAAVHEPDGEAVYAELAHVPYGRVANVALRPALRPYEITYMSGTEKPEQFEIPARDLTVRVVNGRVELYSRRLGKKVIPRLTTAYTHANPMNLPLFRFLGALQTQGESEFGWSWGGALSEADELPRVTCGRLLLSRARWRVRREDAKGGPDALLDRLRRRGTPNRVAIKANDNFLELDLSQALDLALLQDELRRATSLILEEAFDDEDLIADADGALYRQEVMIPFVAVSPPAKPTTAKPIVASAYPPGSEWLYAQIFAGPAHIDELIVELFPRFERLVRDHGCERAFFIRYNEGGMHLRLRAQGAREALWGPVQQGLHALLEPYLGGPAYRLRYDTYLPEYNRYGGPELIGAYERLFAADSLATAEGLAIVRKLPRPEDFRWRFAFMSMAAMLEDLVGEDDGRIELSGRMARAYAAEFQMRKAQNENLKKVYRYFRPFFDAALNPSEEEDPLVLDLRELLARRSAANRAIVGPMIALQSVESFHASVESILHMAANRIFLENARAHELVLFAALEKTLQSMRARRQRRVEIA